MIGYNYLVTKDELKDFGPNDLEKFNFIAVLRLSDSYKSLHPAERPLIQTHIAKHLSERVLFVFEQELEKLADSVFLKQLCTIVEQSNHGERISFFGISEEVGEGIFLKPAVVGINTLTRGVESRFPYFEAIKDSLSEVIIKITACVMEATTFHWAPRLASLCIPRGHLIKHQRERIGTPEAVLGGVGVPQLNMDKETLRKAESYEPISKSILELLGKYLDQGDTQLQYYRVVGHAETLRSLRRKTGLSLHQLLEHFQLHNPGYFDVLESGSRIPEEALRYAQYRYKEILNRPIFMKNLLDLGRMKEQGDF